MTMNTINKVSKAKKTPSIFARYIETAKLRRAEKELLKLDDRMLADIGVSRSDVHGKVWGQF